MYVRVADASCHRRGANQTGGPRVQGKWLPRHSRSPEPPGGSPVRVAHFERRWGLVTRWGAAALALALGDRASAQDSIRCPGGLVTVGDRKLDLLARCGPASHEESHQEERVVTLIGPGEEAQTVRTRVVVERWTYDRGPGAFLQFVTLAMGRIAAIARGTWGTAGAAEARDPPPPPRARCAPESARAGDSAYEVLRRCGEPALRERASEARIAERPHAAGAVEEEVRYGAVEVWSYDFGPNSFSRHLTLLDGKVVRVDTGTYGYAR